MMKIGQSTMLKPCKLTREAGGHPKRVTKLAFGWLCEVLRDGEVMRSFECRDLTEARRCEQGITRKSSPSRWHSPVYSKPREVEHVNNDT